MNERVETFHQRQAAAILADAWRSGSLLSELPAAVRPRTMAQGYDIQDLFVSQIDQPTVGWKLGDGSTLQKRQSGVGRSIAGRILRSHLFSNGDTVPLPNAAPVTVEFEIAYVLGREVRPEEASARDVVGEVRVAFELVLSRFIATAAPWAGPVLQPTPEAALADLLAIARERQMVLPKGSIVSTGTVSKPFNIETPHTGVRARFLGTELGFRTEVIGRTVA
jgi:2-keto-4-pentenoate hydratase